MATYDDWKTTEPDVEPAPGEHVPYDEECDFDECLEDRQNYSREDALLDEDIERGESDYEDCP